MRSQALDFSFWQGGQNTIPVLLLGQSHKAPLGFKPHQDAQGNRLRDGGNAYKDVAYQYMLFWEPCPLFAPDTPFLLSGIGHKMWLLSGIRHKCDAPIELRIGVLQVSSVAKKTRGF